MAEITALTDQAQILRITPGTTTAQVQLDFQVQLTAAELATLTAGTGGILNLAVRLKGDDGLGDRDDYLFLYQQAITALSPQLQPESLAIAPLTPVHCQFEVKQSTLDEDQGSWLPGSDRDEVYAELMLSLATSPHQFGQELTPWVRTNTITAHF